MTLGFAALASQQGHQEVDSQGQDPALKVTMAGFGCSVYQVVNLYESTPRPTPGPPFDPPPPFSSTSEAERPRPPRREGRGL
jgi:hypothetical protein